ncbi:ADP-heptose:LPS heptosyltransferase [Butyrivibrio fibrisolvens 16/4]|nr:ADP-heptose:LPS heptosyltransferase [Butyrivibrio fibrisolvens 16/4]
MGDFLIGKNWMYHLINEFNLINDTWEVFIDKVAYNRGKDIFEISTYVDSVNCGYELLDDTNQYDVIIHFCIVPYIQYFAGEIVYYNNIEFGKYILRLMDFGFENYCMGFCRNPKFYSTIRKLMEKFPERKYHNLCDLFGNLGIQDEYSFSLSIEKDENEYLSSLGLLNNSFITINTGLNRDYNAVSSTRAWSIANWDRLAQLLKAKRSDIQIVQVGEKMQDDCVIKADINLNGKTSIDEARILMKKALIHVDYDGGLVHVRHILNGGPSVILFGPTNVFRHSYKENIGIRTSDCPEDCEWLTDKWLFECPKGYDKAICMESINPEYVCERIIDILDNIN